MPWAFAFNNRPGTSPGPNNGLRTKVLVSVVLHILFKMKQNTHAKLLSYKKVFNRAPDKLLFGVKYSIILRKNQLSFKRWGTITQLIDRVPYLFLTSGVNLKPFSVRKA